MMILRRKRVTPGNPDLVTATDTSVDAGVGGARTRRVHQIKIPMLRLQQEVAVLV